MRSAGNRSRTEAAADTGGSCVRVHVRMEGSVESTDDNAVWKCCVSGGVHALRAHNKSFVAVYTGSDRRLGCLRRAVPPPWCPEAGQVVVSSLPIFLSRPLFWSCCYVRLELAVLLSPFTIFEAGGRKSLAARTFEHNFTTLSGVFC